jgi:hypothetical protein
MSTANFSPDSIRDDDDSRTVRVKVRNNFNYVTLALNALQDSFKKALKAVSDSIIKPALRGGFNLNDIRYYGTLPNAIASIPTGSAQTIYITMALSITSNTVVPSNLSLVVCKGGSFAISGGVTLTINGSFDGQGNAITDIFSGAGAYVFGKAVRLVGAGTPESAVPAPIGSEYLRNNGGAGTTLYVKESGTGNTGWVVPGSGFTGSGATNRVSYWSSATNLTSSASLLFDGTTLIGSKGVFTSDFTLGSSSLASDAALAYNAGTGAMEFTPTTANFNINPTVAYSRSGLAVKFTVSNTSNTASSEAQHVISVAGTSAADPTIRYNVTGATSWTHGIDNSVSGDPFVLAASGALGTSNVLSITTTDFTLTGDFKLGTAGNGLYIKEGTNATLGNGTLVGGTLVVNTTKVTANSEIFIGDKGGGVLANAGALYEDSTARVAGTSFTVKSLNVLDTSKFCWMIVEPA